jgi:hypothetical protein
MTTPYLTFDEFKGLSLMPSGDLDSLEEVSPGWIDSQLAYWSAQIDSRLRKRYAAPFSSPYPLAVQGWLARIVTVRCYLKVGVRPSDEQFAEIKADADAAIAEIKESADSVVGLFDLPLRADTTSTGVSKGAPMVYSEASPYAWTDVQGAAGRTEDNRGGGSYG